MDLSGVRVLDLTRLLPGPYGTQLLADLGADVVKVEPPGGDYAREMTPLTDDGVGRLFDAVNRGKRSVALDLKAPGGREAFFGLVETADVVFEGFRPGVADRLGVGYDDVREHAPDVVYCSLSGYGQAGPYGDRVGHDLNYVGVAGLLDMTRRGEGERPRIPGLPVADMAGGLFAAFAIVGALLSRELSGGDGAAEDTGEYVDVSMTDVIASLTTPVAADALAGEDPRPAGTPLTGRDPWYDVYEAADGRYLTLAALEPGFWANFCDAVDRDDLRAAHGTTDPAERRALREAVADVFAARPRAAWLDELADQDVPVGPVNTPVEALADPQLRARDLVVGSPAAGPRLGFPAATDSGTAEATTPPPALAEHTEALLREAGFDDADLDRLRESGAIPAEG